MFVSVSYLQKSEKEQKKTEKRKRNEKMNKTNPTNLENKQNIWNNSSFQITLIRNITLQGFKLQLRRTR